MLSQSLVVKVIIDCRSAVRAFHVCIKSTDPLLMTPDYVGLSADRKSKPFISAVFRVLQGSNFDPPIRFDKLGELIAD